MINEKRIGNIRWLSEDNLKIRIAELSDRKSAIWITIDNSNIVFSMIMWDFVDWCEREVNLKIEFKKNLWKNQECFIVEKKDELILLGETRFFIKEMNFTPSERNYVFSDDEWYSV